jgi:hypothetical protein
MTIMVLIASQAMTMKVMMKPQSSRRQAKFKIKRSEGRKSKMKGV